MGRDPHPFYVPPDALLPDDRIRFPEEEARHLLQVLRFREGDVCRVVDGAGTLVRVRIEGKGRRVLEGRILSRERVKRGRILGLGFPLLRQRARTEWLLEKAVEVGADRLVPIDWAHGIRKGSLIPRARWERILVEAMKQSERAWLPRLEERTDPDRIESGIGVVLADPEGEEEPSVPSGAAEIRLLVGPEGGVTREERDFLVRNGASLWSLGPTRLRAETACVVGLHRLAQRAGAGDRHVGRNEATEHDEGEQHAADR